MVSTQPRLRFTTALAVGLAYGCVGGVDGTGAPRADGSGAGGAGGVSSSAQTGGSGASKAATGGAAANSTPTGGGGSECRFACPDDSGISVGSGGAGPEPSATDASSRDASSRDASNGSMDAGAPPPGCSSDSRLCDDFESYGEGKVPDGRWQTQKAPSTGASLVVDGTKAFSGTKALHVKVNFTGSGGSVDIATKQGDAAFANLATNTMFARFMMFQGTLTVPGELHARFVRMGNMNAPSGSNQTGYSFAMHSYP